MSALNGQKVLVTGASGLVGSHLAERLLGLGSDVRVTVHRKDIRISDARLDIRRGDLRDPVFCQDVVKEVRYVFHCAANTSGAQVMTTTPMAHVTPNVVMNSYLFDAAYHAGVHKVLWLSSTTGYPDTGLRPIVEEDMLKGEPYAKYFFVGWMKRYTEVLAQMYSEKLPRKMPIVVLRPSNIYGEHDDFEPATSHVLPALIRKVAENQNPLVVWGNGHDVRDLIHISDMIDSIILGIEKIDTLCPLNIGLGDTISVREMLAILLELEPYNPTVTFDESKPTMIPIRKVDVSKAERVLGFKAKVGIKEGIARTLDWYRRIHSGVSAGTKADRIGV